MGAEGCRTTSSIRNNIAASETPWDTVRYHAQQAAEKMLKAFLVFRGRAPERPMTSLLVERLRLLRWDARRPGRGLPRPEPLFHGRRYPEDLAGPGEAEGRAPIAAAQRVFDAVRQRTKMGESLPNENGCACSDS